MGCTIDKCLELRHLVIGTVRVLRINIVTLVIMMLTERGGDVYATTLWPNGGLRRVLCDKMDEGTV